MLRQGAGTAVKSLAGSAVLGLLGTAAAVSVWNAPEQARAIVIGAGASWLAASVSATALILAKAVSARVFWWAFGSGFAIRLLGLAGVVCYGLFHPQLSQPGLLLSYAVGVPVFLIFEYSHIKLIAPT